MNNWQIDPKQTRIVAELDSWLNALLQRPSMFASSPEALEDIIGLVDRVKCIVAGTEIASGELFGYSAFLRSKGFGAGTFCSRRRTRTLTDEDQALFSELGEFVKEYLQSDLSRIPV